MHPLFGRLFSNPALLITSAPVRGRQSTRKMAVLGCGFCLEVAPRLSPACAALKGGATFKEA
jgi:hypothetical protein